MALGDSQFLFGDVAGKADHFHAVEQWPGNRVEGVGGADEQHFGQVQAQVQVMVEEVDVLFRVEGLQQRRGGVALVALAHLVDLVEHDDRVHYADVLQGLHQFARLGADVGAPVPLDLGFVAHAANTEAVERPSQGFGNGFADAGLADAWRAYEQDNRTAYFALVGTHRKKLKDSLLDVVEAGMVKVQHLARMLEVKLVFAVNAPGQGGCPVQVVAGDGILR